MDRSTMEQRSDGNYKMNKNPIKPMDMKRLALAKKKAEIIKGQNTQTAAGSGYKPFTGPIKI